VTLKKPGGSKFVNINTLLERRGLETPCGTYGREERCILGLVGSPEGKRPLPRPRRRWKDNIKMDFQEVGWGNGLDWSGSG
jgi:hypothetical protein